MTMYLNVTHAVLHIFSQTIIPEKNDGQIKNIITVNLKEKEKFFQ